MKKASSKTTLVIVSLICIILAASLAGAMVNYTNIVNQKDSELTNKNLAINNLHLQVTKRNEEIEQKDESLSLLQTQLSNKEEQIQQYEQVIKEKAKIK